MTRSFLKLSKENKLQIQGIFRTLSIHNDQRREHHNQVLEQLLTSIQRPERQREMHLTFENRPNFLTYTKTWETVHAVSPDNHYKIKFLHIMCSFKKSKDIKQTLLKEN